ncbi:23S rRNA (cytosine1962-C5)-methyltransferase [Ulvibacter sp. MAR_2010_11]|uniref:class I SAM-dependent rRNA methyltransferase n=1 Tax=Ulvibacter sp. MAR_2010_11 TaxID=1250229 RepID=UPI000C2B7DB2|nr:class I SAM-dependent rRNA methyltransferase [Ulvibacter sp. MAR_2010_11]PKA84189.1 23S rRNA (cytosine1962-C5)-methyltransferase [Ulvibacter sp. MAR_2010_11]
MFNFPFPNISPQRLAIKLTVVGERSVRSGHPWIFTDSIEKVNKEGKSGDIAIIFSHTKNKAIGIGLYDPHSPIRIKMLHHEGSATPDSDFFSEKIQRAFALRAELLETKTNGYRLLFGENDGFPGFIADVYTHVLVVKLYSAIWFPYFEMILKSLLEVSGCDCVVLRLSRSLQTGDSHGFSDGQIIYGELPNEEVHFMEHGIAFSANVIKGHKTGYFLDHRHNRKQVGAISKGKTVLDVFAYAGGFSVHALANGATEVTSLDISSQALDLAVANAKLNSSSGSHRIITGDAFAVLKEMVKEYQTFDVVVIDPPSFAKSKKEIAIAKKKYAQLAQLGLALTAEKGMLVLASCSSRVSAEEFFEINETVLKGQSRRFKQWLRTRHDVDHPVTFPEGAYLKCGYYQFT